MAAFGAAFESSDSIESRRESKRKEREEVLRKVTNNPNQPSQYVCIEAANRPKKKRLGLKRERGG